jgi:tellurium resistance protein TerZ
MGIDYHANPRDHVYADAESDLKEIVMGLHWDPPREGVPADPENLDALCVLYDEQCRVLEIVHPGHPRNANGSVIHTGDARTGASEWDDERIFIFLEALPAAVSMVAFVVASATGGAFGEIHGASCHISDRITEREWVRLELTTLGRHTAYCVATLRREPAGWKISPDAQTVRNGFLSEPELLSLAASVRSGRG